MRVSAIGRIEHMPATIARRTFVSGTAAARIPAATEIYLSSPLTDGDAEISLLGS